MVWLYRESKQRIAKAMDWHPGNTPDELLKELTRNTYEIVKVKRKKK